MNAELLNVISEMKPKIYKKIEETLGEVPHFNRAMKNKLITRMYDVINQYNPDIKISQIEDFVDIELYPLINERCVKITADSSNKVDSTITTFIKQVEPIVSEPGEKEEKKTKINDSMNGIYTSMDELKNEKINLDNLFAEIEDYLIKKGYIKSDDFNWKKEGLSVLRRTKEETESYYIDSRKKLASYVIEKAEEVYQAFNYEFGKDTSNEQSTNQQNATENPFL